MSDMNGLKAGNSPGAKMTVTVPLSKSGLKIQWILTKGSLLLIAGQNDGWRSERTSNGTKNWHNAKM